MTEMQNTTNHGAPLGAGEVRTHNVGPRHFVVMHAGGGMYTQAKVIDAGGSTVLKTSMREHEALQAYADAIAAAEAEQPKRLDLSLAIAECKRFEEIDRAAVARGESANWWERTDEAPSRSLAELVAAYGEAMARGGMEMALAYGKGLPIDTAAEPHAECADALKAEILQRFGGER